MIRTSINLTDEMHDWYKKEAEKIGISLNAMFIFALLQYQREQMVIPNVGDMIEAYHKFKDMQE